MDVASAPSPSKTVTITATRGSTLDAVVGWSLRHTEKTYRVEHGSTTWYVENGRRFQKRSATSWSNFKTILFGAFCSVALLSKPAAAATTTGGSSLFTLRNATHVRSATNNGPDLGSSFDISPDTGQALFTFFDGNDIYALGANVSANGDLCVSSDSATLVIDPGGVRGVYNPVTWMEDTPSGSKFGLAGTVDGIFDLRGRVILVNAGHLALPGSEFPMLSINNDDGADGWVAKNLLAGRRVANIVDPSTWSFAVRGFNHTTDLPYGSDVGLSSFVNGGDLVTLGPYSFVAYHKGGSTGDTEAVQMEGTSQLGATLNFGVTRTFSGKFAPFNETRVLGLFEKDSGLRLQIVDISPSGPMKTGSEATITSTIRQSGDGAPILAAIDPYVLTVWERSDDWKLKLSCVDGDQLVNLVGELSIPEMAGAGRATLRAYPKENRFYLQYEVGNDIYVMRIDLHAGGTTTGITSGLTSGLTSGISGGGAPTTPPVTLPTPPTSPPQPMNGATTGSTSSSTSTTGPVGSMPPPPKPGPLLPILLGSFGGITLFGVVFCLAKRKKNRSSDEDFVVGNEMKEVPVGENYDRVPSNFRDGGYLAAPGAAPNPAVAAAGRPGYDSPPPAKPNQIYKNIDGNPEDKEGYAKMPEPLPAAGYREAPVHLEADTRKQSGASVFEGSITEEHRRSDMGN